MVLLAATALLAAATQVPGPPSPGVVRPHATSSTAVDSVGAQPLTGDQERPNIVVIMTDDMRHDELKYLPNVQRLLVDQGVRFVNSFTPHPVCCPSRSSFFSGQYTHNHGVWSKRSPYGFKAFDDDHALPVWLQRVGYNTALTGKYLNGYGSQDLPEGSPSQTYVPPGWNDWKALVFPGVYRYYGSLLNVNGAVRDASGRYQTTLLGDQAVGFVHEYATSPRPFFVFASFVAPHIGPPVEKDDPEAVTQLDGDVVRLSTPARPPRLRDIFDEQITSLPGTFEADVGQKPYYVRREPPITEDERVQMVELARQRAEALWGVDQQVKRVVEALKMTGELDDTVIVFTSDNGYFLGEHHRRTGKQLPYDPSSRVPLVIRGPGLPQGETAAAPFFTTDAAPTLLELAGARPRASVDGISMVEAVRTTRDTWVRPLLIETGPLEIADPPTREGDWLDEPEGPSLLRFTQAVRTPDYYYAEHASRERELYDLRSDPAQNVNLVEDPARRETVRQLAALLDRLRVCEAAECARPLPPALRQRELVHSGIPRSR